MHIALVEDEKKLSAIIREGLEAEKYMVVPFYDGATAEEALLKKDARFSLIILDLSLPRKDGFEVCAAIRKKGVTTPILVLTARESVEDKVRALDSGADDFLTKPFSFDELVARIRALDRRSRGRIVEEIKIQDVKINTNTRKVMRAGTEVSLTPTEFEILLMLIENSERSLPREEISMRLWDTDETSLSNVVDVHISNLRKKIDDDYDTKIIRTVRGMGYTVQK